MCVHKPVRWSTDDYRSSSQNAKYHWALTRKIKTGEQGAVLSKQLHTLCIMNRRQGRLSVRGGCCGHSVTQSLPSWYTHAGHIDSTSTNLAIIIGGRVSGHMQGLLALYRYNAQQPQPHQQTMPQREGEIEIINTLTTATKICSQSAS